MKNFRDGRFDVEYSKFAFSCGANFGFKSLWVHFSLICIFYILFNFFKAMQFVVKIYNEILKQETK